MTNRKFKRIVVHCRILDYSIKNGVIRDCIDFSQNGLKISGKALKDNFELTILLPNSNKQHRLKVRKIYQSSLFFGVKILEADENFKKDMAWWD